jgi:hypothetical protein
MMFEMILLGAGLAGGRDDCRSRDSFVHGMAR